MKKIKLKILIASLTFIIGIAAVLVFAFRVSIFSKFNTPSNISVEAEDSEEYAVYSALLNKMFIKKDVNLLVISNRANFKDLFGEQSLSLDERLQHKGKYFASVADDTFIDYVYKSTQTSELKYNFNLPVKYVLINEDELFNKILMSDAEKEKEKKAGKYFLFEKYPDAGGLINFSKIGFNKDKTQAFVDVEFTFCGLCGSGNYVFLEKKEGIWKVKEIFNRWVS